MTNEKSNKAEEVLNNLPEQGYSKNAAKAIKQWYDPKN
jgi:predicted Ser/Thr protein kinase